MDWKLNTSKESVYNSVETLQKLFSPIAIVSLIFICEDKEFYATGRLGKVGNPAMADFIINKLSSNEERIVVIKLAEVINHGVPINLKTASW